MATEAQVKKWLDDAIGPTRDKVEELYNRLEGFKIQANQLTPQNHLGPEDSPYVGLSAAVELIWKVRDLHARFVSWNIKADQLTPQHYLDPTLDQEFVGMNSRDELIVRLRQIHQELRAG